MTCDPDARVCGTCVWFDALEYLLPWGECTEPSKPEFEEHVEYDSCDKWSARKNASSAGWRVTQIVNPGHAWVRCTNAGANKGDAMFNEGRIKDAIDRCNRDGGDDDHRPPKYRCCLCGATYSLQSALDAHTNKRHGGTASAVLNEIDKIVTYIGDDDTDLPGCVRIAVDRMESAEARIAAVLDWLFNEECNAIDGNRFEDETILFRATEILEDKPEYRRVHVDYHGYMMDGNTVVAQTSTKRPIYEDGDVLLLVKVKP